MPIAMTGPIAKNGTAKPYHAKLLDVAVRQHETLRKDNTLVRLVRTEPIAPPNSRKKASANRSEPQPKAKKRAREETLLEGSFQLLQLGFFDRRDAIGKTENAAGRFGNFARLRHDLALQLLEGAGIHRLFQCANVRLPNFE